MTSPQCAPNVAIAPLSDLQEVPSRRCLHIEIDTEGREKTSGIDNLFIPLKTSVGQ